MGEADHLMNYNFPLVSIVTPSFNQAQFLEQAVHCVLSQDYPYIEHVVIDGGSTDGSIELLQELSKKYNEKLIWISQHDNGQTEGLNKGFRIARGEIIGWLNADDLYMPYAVRKAVEVLQSDSEISMVHGNGQYVNEIGEILMSRKASDVTLEQLICVNTIMSIATFWKRNVFEQIGYMDESLHYVMDWEYWVRMSMAGLKMKHINGPVLALSREHNDSKTIQYKERFWQERFMVFKSIFNSPDIPQKIKKIEKRAYSGVYMSGAYFYLRYGRFSKAIPKIWQSLITWPGILLMFNPLLIIENFFQIIKANLNIGRKRI